MSFEPDFSNGLGILHGWRQIARHIGKSERTTRRWYDNHSLPVRHYVTGRAFALASELDKYMLILSDLLRNNPEVKEKQRQHAAYMRSCKKKI